MAYVFHLVPDNMTGHQLLPLAELSRSHPALYAIAIKKYESSPLRQALPRQPIRKLGCEWQDVLHFAPVHPHLIFRGVQEFFPEARPGRLFYKIPIDRIKGLPTVVFDMIRTGTYEHGREGADDLYELFDYEGYRMLESLPPEAIASYRESKERGETAPLLFARIPHIMVKGGVDISGCEAISWSAPIDPH